MLRRAGRAAAARGGGAEVVRSLELLGFSVGPGRWGRIWGVGYRVLGFVGRIRL